MINELSRVVIAITLAASLVACASAQKDWSTARSADTIAAYEAFLRQHPTGETATQARARLNELRAPNAWARAVAANTVEAYEEFARVHGEDKRAAEARRRAGALRSDLPAWQAAQSAQTIEALEKFLRENPQSPFAEQARAKIVDLEVSDILKQPHGRLPAADRVSTAGVRSYAVVNVHNDTKYNLTIRYSGPESFKVVFSPQDKGSIELLPGAYKVAASVDAARVRQYAGAEQVAGGNYQVEFYIVTTGPGGKTEARAPQGRNDAPFAPWPTKRSVAEFVKMK